MASNSKGQAIELSTFRMYRKDEVIGSKAEKSNGKTMMVSIWFKLCSKRKSVILSNPLGKEVPGKQFNCTSMERILILPILLTPILHRNLRWTLMNCNNNLFFFAFSAKQCCFYMRKHAVFAYFTANIFFGKTRTLARCSARLSTCSLKCSRRGLSCRNLGPPKTSARRELALNLLHPNLLRTILV